MVFTRLLDSIKMINRSLSIDRYLKIAIINSVGDLFWEIFGFLEYSQPLKIGIIAIINIANQLRGWNSLYFHPLKRLFLLSKNQKEIN